MLLFRVFFSALVFASQATFRLVGVLCTSIISTCLFFSGENEYYCISICALYHTVDILWKITLGYVAEGSTSFVLHYIIRRHRCPRWSMCGRLLLE